MAAAAAAAAGTFSAPAQASTPPGPGYVWKSDLPSDGCASQGWYGQNITHEWASYVCVPDGGSPNQGVPQHSTLWVHA